MTTDDNSTSRYEAMKEPGPLDRLLALGRKPDPRAARPGTAPHSVPRAAKPRCGPWVDGVCQKCGRRDPLDIIDDSE